MRITIRYLGMLILDKEIVERDYTIGRAQNNDIQLTQDFVSRHHGKLIFRDESWYYEDLRSPNAGSELKLQSADVGKKIDLGGGLILILRHDAFEEKTEIGDLNKIPKIVHELEESRKKIQWLSGALTVLLSAGLAAGIYAYLKFPKNPSSLMASTKTKVVEFQHPAIEELKAQLQNMAQLTPSDIKEHTGFCSGFLVGPNLILTAFHCLLGESPVEINTRFELVTNSGQKLAVEKILDADPKVDYALLSVQGADSLGYFEFAEQFQIGEKVFTLGNVEGEGTAIRDGLLASKTKDADHEDLELLRYSAAASPGNSGGPLINSEGKVLGLVFAKSSAENYNVAIPSNLLQEKVTQAKMAKEKKVEFEIRTVPDFALQTALGDLGLPWLSTWEDTPEDTQALDHALGAIDLPSTLDAFAQNYSEAMIRTLGSSYDELLQKMKDEKRLDGSWISLSDASSGALYAPDFFDSTDYKLLNNAMLPMQLRASFAPPHRYLPDYWKTLQQGEFVPLEGESFVSLLNDTEESSDYVYAPDQTTKKTLESFRLEADFIAVSAKDSAQIPAMPGDQAFPTWISKHILGNDGVLMDTTSIDIVKPKSQKSFTITELKSEPIERQLLDDHDRVWSAYRWKILESQLIAFCLPVLDSVSCVRTLSDLNQVASIEKFEENFIKYFLSELYFHHPYVNPIHLNDSKSKRMRNSLVLRDLLFNLNKDGSAQMRFKTLGLKMKIPKSLPVLSLRVLGGLAKVGKESQFVALGMDMVTKKDKRYYGCSLATELIGAIRHPAFAAYERQKKKFSKSKRPVRDQSYRFKNLGTKGKVWTFCTALKIDKDQNDVNWDVNDKIPFPIEHYVLNSK